MLGNGFTKAVECQTETSAADMACDYAGFPLDDKLKDAAQQAAVAMGVARQILQIRSGLLTRWPKV